MQVLSLHCFDLCIQTRFKYIPVKRVDNIDIICIEEKGNLFWFQQPVETSGFMHGVCGL